MAARERRGVGAQALEIGLVVWYEMVQLGMPGETPFLVAHTHTGVTQTHHTHTHLNTNLQS